jgi:hypothetical protein
MALRRTKGIVSDVLTSDPTKEAEVIITAAALGLAADYIATTKKPIQFDMDPLEQKDPKRTALFQSVVGRMDKAVDAYLRKKGIVAATAVHQGLSPGYHEGAAIMGVYLLAGQQVPGRVPPTSGTTAVASPPLKAPILTKKGQAVWQKIATIAPDLAKSIYTGYGAYTGFVDNPNTVGNTDPVGPLSTVRMPVPPATAPTPHPRWLPPTGHLLWNDRLRKGSKTSFVPWGLIGGGDAGKDTVPTPLARASNLADQITVDMNRIYGMAFVGDIKDGDIAAYTHGMIQAIYKAYALGPSCTPFEIAVGDVTKKMASCLGCTLFMHACGYPPTSIHLGRAESWAPLYAPYSPGGGSVEPNEAGVIRDLNNRWYEKCLEWLKLGLTVLDDAHIETKHASSRDAVAKYLTDHGSDPTVGGVLILDALTLHRPEVDRLNETLQ